MKSYFARVNETTRLTLENNAPEEVVWSGRNCLVKESEFRHRGYAAEEFMAIETSRETTFAVILICLALGLTCRVSIHVLYKRGLQRFERRIKAAYAAQFEKRALIARSQHAPLDKALQRSKAMVNQMRARSMDGTTVQNELSQVSEWLDEAAAESDIAMRALELSPRTDARRHIYREDKYNATTETDKDHDR